MRKKKGRRGARGRTRRRRRKGKKRGRDKRRRNAIMKRRYIEVKENTKDKRITHDITDDVITKGTMTSGLRYAMTSSYLPG